MIAPLDYSTLNPEQKEAVEYGNGPILIFAGAGSGKTRVITYRVARLISTGIPAYRILAVTFTNKSAKEMKERISALTGEEVARSMWVGTFHSLGSRLLRIEGSAIGIDRNFVIYDDSDQLTLIKEIMKGLDIDEKAFTPRNILATISHAKEQLQSPAQFETIASGYFEKICADIYKIYAKKLKSANALDFDDILFFTVRLLEQSQDVREKYQDRFMHILVDEYQDVNLAQYKIIQLLSDKHKNVVAVGDDDQSIYAWRGADVGLILKFSTDYPNTKVIKLEQNYRSTAKILAAANEVIRHNHGRAPKALWTDKAGGTQVTLTQAGTEQDEAGIVADAVTKDVNRGRRKFGDFAVLYRTNAQSRVMEEAFLTMRVPHLLVGGQRFYDRKEVKDAIAYLRLVMNPRDNISLRRVINTPVRGIGNSSIATAEKFALEFDVSLLAAFETQDVQSGLSKKAGESVRSFCDAISGSRELSEKGLVTPVLKYLLNRTGYLDSLRAEHSEEAAGRLENLQELLNVTAEYDATDDEPNLIGFLESVSLIADVDKLNQGSDAVTLMTIHSAKGLEFPVVFVVGLEEGVFPHSRSLASDTQLSEERRLAYVAMTRAREELHLLHASRRSLYGTPNFNRRSRFIDDLPEETLGTLMTDTRHSITPDRRSPYQDRDGSYSSTRQVTHRSGENISRRDDANEIPVTWEPPFQVGNRVHHAKFGTGVVIACVPIRDDAEITVAFPGIVGMKKLVQKFAKLELVG